MPLLHHPAVPAAIQQAIADRKVPIVAQWIARTFHGVQAVFGHSAAQGHVWAVERWFKDVALSSSTCAQAVAEALENDHPDVVTAILDRAPRSLTSVRSAFLRFAAQHQVLVDVNTLWQGSVLEMDDERRRVFQQIVEQAPDLSEAAARLLIQAESTDRNLHERHLTLVGRTAIFDDAWSALAVVLEAPGFPAHPECNPPFWPALDERGDAASPALQDRFLACAPPEALPQLAHAKQARQRHADLAQRPALARASVRRRS